MRDEIGEVVEGEERQTIDDLDFTLDVIPQDGKVLVSGGTFGIMVELHNIRKSIDALTQAVRAVRK